MSAPEPSRATWMWVAGGATAIVALLAIANPRAALALSIAAAIGLAATALAYAVARLMARVRPAQRSAFAPAIYQRPPQILPQHIARMAPDTDGRNRPITEAARSALVTVATERLWAHHGLNVHLDTDREQVRSMISADLWHQIKPGRDGRSILPHSQLGRLLDELEHL